MSVNTIPPISLHEIRHNFVKSDDVASSDRYVRDFNALQGDETFDLLDYNGAAFGFQHEFMGREENEPYWQKHGTIYELPLDESDRRADYAVNLEESIAEYRPWKGKRSVGLYMVQDPVHKTPGAIGVNGWFYASDVGESNPYEANWVLRTGGVVPPNSEIWGMLFGYRFGYLDGQRVDYSIQRVVNPERDTEYAWSDTFTVDKDYRHCLMNFSLWMPGYGHRETMSGFIHSCTIKRKP
jgi:hypothetical protein